MVYAILPALVPEVEKVYDVYFAAFKNERMGSLMVDILFPGGTEGAGFRKAHTEATVAWLQKATSQYTYKCIDTETGEIIGMALGDVHFHQRTEEERAYQSVGWLQGAEKEKADAVLRPLHEAREKLFGGKPHIYVHVIAIHPKYQGRQAGALWCRWGIDLCNSLGVPLYFEASPSTFRLYEKMGYQIVQEKVVHSAELMGTSTDIEVPLMVKMPDAAQGLGFEEWRAAGYPAFGKGN